MSFPRQATPVSMSLADRKSHSSARSGYVASAKVQVLRELLQLGSPINNRGKKYLLLQYLLVARVCRQHGDSRGTRRRVARIGDRRRTPADDHEQQLQKQPQADFSRTRFPMHPKVCCNGNRGGFSLPSVRGGVLWSWWIHCSKFSLVGVLRRSSHRPRRREAPGEVDRRCTIWSCAVDVDYMSSTFDHGTEHQRLRAVSTCLCRKWTHVPQFPAGVALCSLMLHLKVCTRRAITR